MATNLTEMTEMFAQLLRSGQTSASMTRVESRKLVISGIELDGSRPLSPPTTLFFSQNGITLQQHGNMLSATTTNSHRLTLSDAAIEHYRTNHANLPDPDGYNRIHRAALANDIEQARLLLAESGVTVDAKNTNGQHTALHIAAHQGNEAMVRLLLLHGADARITANCGDNAENFARKARHHAIADFIQINSLDQEGYAPLHRAVLAKKLEDVQDLLKRGALTDLPNKDKYTALHIAANFGAKDIVTALLDNGADTALKSNDTYTAEDFARLSKHTTIEAQIRKHGEKKVSRRP
jgi:ankyrin repeat protein